MNKPLGFALALLLALAAGCSSIDSGFRLPESLGGGVSKTFNVPVARVKPAVVSTLTQMGMPISAIELRGTNEFIKSRKADRSVEIEIERLSATATRVRVSGSGQSRVISETEKRLGATSG
jgi:hypothetical protein